MELAAKKVKLHQLQLKKSRDIFKGTDAEWELLPEVEKYKAKERDARNGVKLWKKQLERLQKSSETHPHFTSFLTTFIASPLGWEIKKLSFGERDKTVQSYFRKALVEACNPIHPQNPNEMWCPATQRWQNAKMVKAAHIFPSRHGGAIMTSIFGTKDELFDVKNGLLLSEDIEECFDHGYLAFVPVVEDIQSDEETMQWLKGSRAYKIKVFKPEAKAMTYPITQGALKNLTFGQLDGHELVFKSDHRPRARYLYFHYLYCWYKTLLDSPNIASKEKSIREELGKPYWGTHGRYIGERFLRGFCEEMGVDFEKIEGHALSIEDKGTMTDIGLSTFFDAQAAAAGEKSEDEDEAQSEVEDSDVEH